MAVRTDFSKIAARFASEGIPIHGFSGRETVDYRPEATPEQRQQGDAILAAFDWDADAALARLITEYDRRRAETLYTIPDGPSVTLLPSTAESLLKMLTIAGRLVATGRGSEALWIDDGPTGDIAVTLTAQQIVDHVGAYTDAIAEIEIWAAQKKAEIEASEDPLGVSL